MNKSPYEKIDFVPTENGPEVAQRMREWIKANAFMALKDCHGSRTIDAYEGGHLYLELGGYVPNPENPERQANVEASFSIASGVAERLEPVTDPEGTYWHRHTFTAHVNWPSYGSQGPQLSRLRADMISVTVELAERFEREFAGTVVWSKGMTQAERDEWALKHQKEASKLKVATHVKEAIHTTCRLMKVGTEKFISAPEGVLAGDYEVEVENKTYRVDVSDIRQARLRFHFRRVK